MLFLLPSALIALVLASPVLAAAPRSVNNPFKAITAQVVKPPEPPVCCLRPLPPTDQSQDDILLSFEEWKEKRFAMETLIHDKEKEKDREKAPNGDRKTENGDSPAPSADPPSSPSPPQDAPHFRVPITDRFNYAGLDCSARVHTTHRAAKSPASILSSKRDRYMLSPCRPNGEKQFIVVELCEDIRIDTVQLANFEFFSGVFKDFTVSVSKTYTTDPDGWTFASTHTAKNIRVVQSFHPPTSLRDFYRYIRIDFHSHYSNEYYCPVSLLRVYGLTHLEEYKWDIWETESRARARRDEQSTPPAPLEVEEPMPNAPAMEIPASYSEYLSTFSTERERDKSPGTGTATEPADEKQTSQAAPQAGTTAESMDPRGKTESPPPMTSESSDPAASVSTAMPSSASVAATGAADTDMPPQNSSSPESTVPAEDNGTASASSVAGDSSRTTTTISALSTGPLVPATISTNTGESIYRTIMNRLTALEANHTLYARYVEEHTGAVRELLRRVAEDLGRADGVGKAQAQLHARTLLEWEQHRKRVDSEYRELMRRVEYLSDEIVLEKRLGIAQLLLLLAVLVFMSLTRGSRGEAVVVPSVSRSALRAWGRRHLSLRNLSGSGDWDWVGRLKSRSRSKSPKPKATAPKPKDASSDPPIKLEFPTVQEKPAQSPVGPTSGSKQKPPRLNLYSTPRPRSRTRSGNTIVYDPGQRATSRTPTLARTPLRRPATPTHSSARSHTPALPSSMTMVPVQHSVSHGGHIPRSARRWARTAHLHELRGVYAHSTPAKETVPRSAAAVASKDVFSSPTPNGPASADLLNEMAELRSGRSGARTGLLFRRDSPGGVDLSRGASDDSDPWVDTDDGSEIGGDLDPDPDPGFGGSPPLSSSRV